MDLPPRPVDAQEAPSVILIEVVPRFRFRSGVERAGTGTVLAVAYSREIRGQMSKAAQLTSNTRRRLLPQKRTDACSLTRAGAISSHA
jgi:hypothetical protein